MPPQDDIEARLRQLPLRAPPPQWRDGILSTARAASSTSRQPGSVTVTMTRQSPWQAWLWPSPRAWAILAGCWMILLALQFSLPTPARPDPSSSGVELSERWPVWLERNRRTAELMRELAVPWLLPEAPSVPAAWPPQQTRWDLEGPVQPGRWA